MFDTHLKSILKELSEKYDTRISIYYDGICLTFPEEKKLSIDLCSTLNHYKLNTINYSIIDKKLFVGFKFHCKNTNLCMILLEPYISSNPIIESNNSSNSCENTFKRKDFNGLISIVHYLLKDTAPILKKESTYNMDEDIRYIFRTYPESGHFYDNYLDSIELEKRFFEAVRRNKPYEAQWILNKLSNSYSPKLSADPLISAKYKCVSIITLLTRVSINANVSLINAYALSDSVIKKIDNISNLNDCLSFIKETTFMFIKLIHTSSLINKSCLVRNILSYIDCNLYSKITLEKISNYVGKHKTYISSTFKSEMGQTIHEYINKRKISEAKYLLHYTNQSYKEISYLLNYSSQSHFIHVFKSIEGITPAQYRLNNDTNYTVLD